MQPDPFGNLKDWGPVLERICDLAENQNLSECQPGLTRVLAYRDNWRLREETLKHIGVIENPSENLIGQVVNIIASSNLYYEVRILACESMVEWLKNGTHFQTATRDALAHAITGQLATPQPPIFEDALKELHASLRKRFGTW